MDAKSYWEFAADMMELAREEIFIADWWLTPEVIVFQILKIKKDLQINLTLKKSTNFKTSQEPGFKPLINSIFFKSSFDET